MPGVQINQSRSSNLDSTNVYLVSYTKYTEKVHGTQQGHISCIPISLCVTKLTQSLSNDKNGRYIGFLYADGKMINQLNECQLEEDKVFHNYVEILEEETDEFIEQSPNPSAWETTNLGDIGSFINTIQYSYKNMQICSGFTQTK